MVPQWLNWTLSLRSAEAYLSLSMLTSAFIAMSRSRSHTPGIRSVLWTAVQSNCRHRRGMRGDYLIRKDIRALPVLSLHKVFRFEVNSTQKEVHRGRPFLNLAGMYFSAGSRRCRGNSQRRFDFPHQTQDDFLPAFSFEFFMTNLVTKAPGFSSGGQNTHSVYEEILLQRRTKLVRKMNMGVWTIPNCRNAVTSSYSVYVTVRWRIHFGARKKWKVPCLPSVTTGTISLCSMENWIKDVS